MNDNTTALDNARKLQRAIALKLERQTKTIEETRAQLSSIDAYIRGLEKPGK